MNARCLARNGWALLAVSLPLGWAVPSLAQAPKTPAPAKAAAPAKTAAPSDPEIIATVNGEKITRTEIANELIDDQLKKLSATDPNFADKARPVAGSVGVLILKRLAAGAGTVSVTRAQVIEWLFKDKPQIVTDSVQNKIREVVIAQAAKAAGVKVSDADMDAQYKKSVSNAKVQLRQEGKSDSQFLAGLGMRPETVRRLTRTSLVLERLMKADIEKKKGSPFGADDYLDARHILIRIVPPAPAKPGEQPSKEVQDKAAADAKAKIDQIAADIKAGKIKFEDAAKQFSDDSSKLQEGKVGVFVRGQMVPDFEKAAFALAAGQVSEPVRSQFGWHLIRVDRVGKDISPAERDTAFQGLMRNKVSGFLSELMSKAKIVNKCQAPPAMPMINMGGGEPE